MRRILLIVVLCLIWFSYDASAANSVLRIYPGDTGTVACQPCPACPDAPPAPPPTQCQVLPFPYKIDSLGLSQGQSVIYCFDAPAIRSNLSVGVSSRDWQGNVDIGVSDVKPVSCAEIGSYRLPPDPAPWFAPTGDSNETVYLIQQFTPRRFYVTFCNRRSDATAFFSATWGGW